MRSYKRIKKLTEAVEFLIEKEGSTVTVADVGADHGYLSESLSRLEKIKKIYAVEISQKCYEKVIKLKQNFNLEKIVPILSDGISDLKDLDITVIAGIGGYESIRIMRNQNKCGKKNKSKYFVLMPSDNSVELRRWIYQQNYLVLKDYVIESAKRFYSVIIVDSTTKSEELPGAEQLYFGKDCNLEDPDFVKYLKHMKELLEYLDTLPIERIEADEVLIEKAKLKTMIENLLNKC